MEYKITKDNEGKTVKQYLFGVLHLSRAQVTKLKVNESGIRLNGSHVTVRQVLTENDVLTLELEDMEHEINEEIVAVKMDLDIVYEDESVIIVNKGGDMPVHPSHNHYEDTLANGLVYYFKKKGVPFNFRAANRLDRETSGLVIVAKSRMAANRFAKLLESRQITKGYISILKGIPEKKSDRIVTHIKRQAESIITRCNCCENEGDIAITDYEVIAEGGGISVVRAFPITGRTHQLRVHFAGIGCPILGDSLYGEASVEISRQALHAEELTFCHPFSNEKMNIKAQLPSDMKRIIKEKTGIDL